MSTQRSPAVRPTPNPASGAAGIEQVYLTHCTADDIVPIGSGPAGAYGFGVRARSTRDPSALRFAAEFFGLVLPADMGMGPLDPKQTPRRLALVRTADGASVLVHTSYLPWDTSTPPRPGSYFTHMLFARRIAPMTAAAAWAAPGWVLEYPQRAAKDLGPIASIPSGGPINDSALSAFLGDGAPDPVQDLATVVFPQRLAQEKQPGDSRKARRQLIQWMLQWAQANGGSPTAARLTLLAEPGLVALLVYAAGRLLPPAFTENLTFSTFETGRSLSNNNNSLVSLPLVATFLRNTQAGLPADLKGRRDGPAIDSFAMRASPELEGPPIEELLDYAAQGRWDQVAEIHEILSRAPRGTKNALVETLRTRPGIELLKQKKANRDTLKKLGSSPMGQTALEPYLAMLQINLLAQGPDPDLARLFAWAFRDLAANLADLRADLRAKLVSGRVNDWQTHWDALVQYLAGRDEPLQQLRALTAEAVSKGEVSAFGLGARLGVLSAWLRADPSGKSLSAEQAWLLSVRGAGELAAIARAGLPTSWIGLAASTAPATEAVAVLAAGDDSLLAGFAEGFAARSDVLDWLAPFALPGDTPPPTWLSRLLARPELARRPSVLDNLLDRLNAHGTGWDATFWTAPNILVFILTKLPAQGAFASKFWNETSELLCAQDLVAGQGRSSRLGVILAARRQLGDRIPHKLARTLEDYALLSNQFAGPAQPVADPASLRAACDRLEAHPQELIQIRFEQEVRASSPGRMPQATIRTLALILKGFHETDDSLLSAWLTLLDTLPPNAPMSDYQREFITAAVPAFRRNRLLPKFSPRLTQQTRDFLSVPAPSAVQIPGWVRTRLPDHVQNRLPEEGFPAPKFTWTLFGLILTSLMCGVLLAGWRRERQTLDKVRVERSRERQASNRLVEQLRDEIDGLRDDAAKRKAEDAIRQPVTNGSPNTPKGLVATEAARKGEKTTAENAQPSEALPTPPHPTGPETLVRDTSGGSKNSPGVAKTENRSGSANADAPRTIQNLIELANKDLNNQDWNEAGKRLQQARDAKRTDDSGVEPAPELAKFQELQFQLLDAWNVSQGPATVKMPDLLDLAPIRHNGKPHLAAISGKKSSVQFYPVLEGSPHKILDEKPIVINLGWQPQSLKTIGPDDTLVVGSKEIVAQWEDVPGESKILLQKPTVYFGFDGSTNTMRWMPANGPFEVDRFAVDPERKWMVFTNNIAPTVTAENPNPDSGLYWIQLRQEHNQSSLTHCQLYQRAMKGSVVDIKYMTRIKQFLVALSNGEMEHYEYANAADGQPLLQKNGVTPFGFPPDVLAFSDAAGMFAACQKSPQAKATIWDVTNGEPRPIQELTPTAVVQSLAISSRGDLVAVGGADQSIWIWDRVSAQRLVEYRAEGVPFRLTFGPDDRYLVAAVGSEQKDKSFQIWMLKPPGPGGAGSRVDPTRRQPPPPNRPRGSRR